MKPIKNRLIVLVGVFLISTFSLKSQDLIVAGYDTWSVEFAVMEFGGFEIPPLPADFFGPGSDPFIGFVDLAGNPLDPLDPGHHATVRRLADVNLPPPYPSFGSVSTEMHAMSLIGVAPITVTYNGGTDPENWDVSVELSDTPAPPGDMYLTKGDPSGGTFSDDPLVVLPRFIFTKSDDPAEVREYDSGLQGDLPIEFIPYSEYFWEQIGDEFFPVGEGPYDLGVLYGNLYLSMIPYTVIQDEFDWGDAPDPTYPTLAASNGANHMIDGIIYLGNLIDAEGNGIPDPNALGDDNSGSPDEDGVAFTSPIIQGQLATVDVFASGDGLLQGWIDFDINGSWAESADQIFLDENLVAGLNNLSFNVPPGAAPGISFARFRFSSQNGLGFEGPAYDGEVEDYEVFIEEGQQDDLDWGDAPDGPYPTVMASNGAHHVIIPQIYLGNSIDGEPDGQPDIMAQGDDQDIIYPPPNDDEDGVIFTSVLISGSTATVNVTASVQAFLNAWIDFNQNGSWADLNDQIFTDQLLNPGVNNLMFNVPAGSTTGNTYARFRFSTLQGLPYDGIAPDGEVEDYRVTVGVQTTDIEVDPDPTGSWVQNEISMAIVPGSPAQLIAAYNDHPYPGGPGLGVSYSHDGGATWNPLQLPYPPDPYGGGNFVDMFDPTATADANGNFYVAHISSDYDWTNGPASGLFVHMSNDGGVTWAGPVAVATDGPPVGSPDPNYRFNDRCQMTCDINPASPYYNNLYIVEIKDRGWNNPLLQSDIYFTSSTDGGTTWSAQVIINENIHSLGNMPVPAVAPDGTVYVCWMDYNVQTGGTGTIYMNISTDGGATWLPNDILVTTVNLPPLNLNGGTDVLAKGAAVIEVSPFNPQEIYITYAERVTGTADEADIFFIRSTDAGQNWSLPIRVNDDLTITDQVLPWMDVKPNGTIDIVWYDRRNDVNDLLWDVYFAASLDGGLTFIPNVRISDISTATPNTPSGLWMGEYLGLVTDNYDAYISFTSSLYDINGDVFFDVVNNPTLEIDFGDANDPTYPTLLSSNGARHMLDGATFLGAGVDTETDGQPDPNAMGDDNDGNDDEDGITFGQILVGSPAQITVTTSVAGYLQGWMDFNVDGDWADPGEQIFVDEYIHFGYTVCLNYSVPLNAISGTTYARFRFSTVPGLTFTGLAQDGEVEDYEVEITENPDIKWIQEPCTELPGLHAHDYIIPPDFYDYIILADDWTCNGGLVTDIHWWGNYELDALNQEKRGSGINHFHISIHADDPTGTCLPLGQMGQALWEADIPFSQVNETATALINSEGGIIYKYDYYLDIPFDQVEGTNYWLDIGAFAVDPNAPAIWRWQESDRSTVPILCPAASMTSTTPWQSIVWTSISPYRYSDMAFVITSEEIVQEIDFGDADDPTYPTLLASDGARHILDGATFLGAGADAEADGQPDPNALGDDNDGNDDEDGITFGQILAGSPAQITVTTSVAGYLQGWMDFNADGDWADPGEQIFVDEYIHFGYTVCLNYSVPLNAISGTTYARFRFSTVPGLTFTGLAQDGEVEDYEVEITENPDIKWIQEPCTELPGLHAHDYIIPPDFYDYIILADDWTCNGGLVTDIHWWGNYELDALNQEKRGSGINHFHISIHADDPTGTCLPLGQMGQALWEADIPFSQVNETATALINSEGGIIYKYDYYLDIPFDQVEGTNYWLDIGAFAVDPNAPAIWRWQESDRSTVPILCPAASMTSTTPWQSIIWTSISPYRYSDMAFVITSEEIQEMDYGDADDPTYPTLLASDGARHILDGATFLGAGADAESDGQPDPNALGDDNDGNDDEDGVTFTSPLYLGQVVSLDVVASTTGRLNAWLDLNANGSWSDIGEQIFIDTPLSAGNNSLSFTIPYNATLGFTYARFRFNTAGGLVYTGVAIDGEVEDYEVEITEVPNKWAQYPDPNLPGLHAHDYDLQPGYGQIILADDWVCQGGWVTDIHWWGNYEIDAFGQEIRGAGIDHFHLSIHNLDTTGGGCIPLDPEVWGVDVPFSSLVEINTGLTNLEGCIIYLYEYYLDEPFPQIEGHHYWLDITAVCVDPVNPAHWRWQESARGTTPILCGAVNKVLPTPGVWQTISWANDSYSDMAFIITSEPIPDIDLGDANDPTYPTLLASNGAAHIIDGVTFLGSSVDAEPDGQPDPNAMGDDNDGNDDEDGVSIIFPFAPGGTAWINVEASTNGILNAWIDYDGNGSWGEADEYIIINQNLVAGTNSFFIPVPPGAVVGTTYARFRFSTGTISSYTGLVNDGEVEDHEIYIEGDLDFGDAADPTYPTLLVSDGARHVVVSSVYLGNSIDADTDGQPDPNALGDDNDGNDDEDGVLLPAVIAPGQMNTLTVVASVNGLLNAWMDYNQDGDWDEPDEKIFMDQALNAGNNSLNFMVPAGVGYGTTYARFRFSTSGGLSYTGQAQDGEVEDYEVEIGDAYKWLQNPDLTDFGIDIDATYDIQNLLPPMILADDFLCDKTGPITRIEVFASWYHDHYPWFDDQGAVMFTLSIHEDIPADQNPLGYSMPGNVLWFRQFDVGEFFWEPVALGLLEGWYNPATGLYEPIGDTECYKYSFLLNQDEFIQEGHPDEPKVYWLDVQATPLDPDPECRFGWKTSIDHWNDNAVWGVGFEPYIGPWDTLYYPPGHPLHPQAIDLAFAIIGQENPYILVDLKVFLEGPYNGVSMNPVLNSIGLIPMNQPYGVDPTAKWYYTGSESVFAIPSTVITDWIMVEFRDAPSAALATGATMVDQRAAFVMDNSSVVATDGSSLIKSYATFTNNPYVVIWHRNHLGILSANPMNLVGLGLYSYDFTTPAGQAYLNGQTNLGGGIYGMYGGDSKPDGSIDNLDKAVWTNSAGTTGYLPADHTMDAQVDNKDKNDIWIPNNGQGTQVPN